MSCLSYARAPVRDCIVVVSAVLSLLACKSAPSKTLDQTTQLEQKSVGIVKASAGPDIDLNCVINRIRNPPESFHYAFKAESDNPWEEQADVTPQMIDGSFKNNSSPVPQQFHGAPPEVSSNLMAIGRMASLFATVRSTSAVVNEGAEKDVNSYNTVKYSIDTTRGAATEHALYESILGPGGSEKGTVWVTSQGCPVRIVLDEELHSKDGSLVGRTHYEEAMIKK
ncbi:MAG TPA: hypothetical protein VFA40_20595 [Terriglobales bacterium]|nr:hypothetical protein [Terriglobales bacterium]